MSNYVFYQIRLFKSQQPSLVADADVPIEEAQKCFSGFLEPSTKLPISTKDNNGDQIVFENTILAQRDDIAIMRLNNKLSKSLVKKNGQNRDGVDQYESTLEESFPYSMIIIDNRPNKLIMAVEKSPAWRSNTSRIRDILQESIGRELRDRYNLDIEINEIVVPLKVWDFCELVCKNRKDHITNISFNIKNPRKTVPYSNNKPALIKEIEAQLSLTGAIGATFGMDYKDGDPSVMKNTVDDLARLAIVCTQKEYTLSIGFQNFGTYRCGEDVAFQRELGPLVLDSIINKVMVLHEGSLAAWIDESIKQIEDLQHAAKIPENRNR